MNPHMPQPTMLSARLTCIVSMIPLQSSRITMPGSRLLLPTGGISSMIAKLVVRFPFTAPRGVSNTRSPLW